MAAQVDSLLQKTRDELHSLADDREATFALRLRHYAARQLQLSHRIVKLAAAIEAHRVLRALPLGGAHGEPPLGIAEQAWVEELQNLAAAIRQPGQGRARLHELRAEIDLQAAAQGTVAPATAGGAARLNLAALRDWLARHQSNLKRLLDVHDQLRRDAAATLATAQ